MTERQATNSASSVNGQRLSLPYRTPGEVAAHTPESPEWLVHGYLARGAITEIDGKIKASGKTTLATHLIAAVLGGRPFLDQPTTSTNVVYLTEQTPQTFRQALSRAKLFEVGSRILILFRAEIDGWPWDALIQAVAEDAQRDGYGLLVVDTLGKLAGIVNENDAGEGARAMTPLQTAAHHGLSVLVLRHDRKGGGDVGESGRGSSAISGDVDIIVQLRRSQGNAPSSRRMLETLSRYDETPERLVVELTEGEYVVLGEHEAVKLAQDVEMLSALTKEEYEQKVSWTIEELIERTGRSRSGIQRAAEVLIGRHEWLSFTDDGGTPRRSHPLQYGLVPEIVSAPTAHVVGQNVSPGDHTKGTP